MIGQPDFWAQALQRLGLAHVAVDSLTDEQWALVEMLEAEERDIWAGAQWDAEDLRRMGYQ